ncbi:MAG: hypothetical protein EZS28_056091, partial [Streblomastix strix]
VRRAIMREMNARNGMASLRDCFDKCKKCNCVDGSRKIYEVGLHLMRLKDKLINHIFRKKFPFVQEEKEPSCRCYGPKLE